MNKTHFKKPTPGAFVPQPKLAPRAQNVRQDVFEAFRMLLGFFPRHPVVSGLLAVLALVLFVPTVVEMALAFGIVALLVVAAVAVPLAVLVLIYRGLVITKRQMYKPDGTLKAVILALAVSGLALAAVGQAEAQVRYTDENGKGHWVASEAHVPERYKDKIKTPVLKQVVDPNNGIQKNTGQPIRRLARDKAPEQPKGPDVYSRAADQARQAAIAEWERVVWGCLRYTQKSEPDFQANLNGTGEVKIFGTAKGRYEYGKCMAESGQPTTLAR